jgi:DNA repair exonuclease SbcCD ATPase subunit
VVWQAIRAYLVSFTFEEKIRFANEIALLKDFWTDVVAEWAEYIRVRAEAIREGLNVLQEAYRRALEENGIPVADIPRFEYKSTDELDEETNPSADSPKAPYVWSSYFKLDRRATLRHVLKYMSRRPIQDIALYCYRHGDKPKLPYDWLDQLINYRNQRSALGLARENYVFLHTVEEVKKFSEQFNKLEEKFNEITAQHPEFAERLAQIAEPFADAKKCIEELGKMLEKGKPPAQETFFTYIETVKFALEKIQQTNVFDAEELKEKQKQLAELNKQKAEIEAVRLECESVKHEIAQLEDWINSGIEREGDRERLVELQKKRNELEQKLTELAPTEQKIAQEMQEILKTLDVAKQTVEFQEEISKARENVEQIENELKEDKHYCPLCGRVTAKPTYLTTDRLAEKVEKGLVLYYVDPETRRARLCVSSKAPNAREVVSFFAVKSYTARAMLELEKSRYVDKVVSEWFVSEFSRSRGDKYGVGR